MSLIRGLTLRHPWPAMFLLDDEPKRIENRDWEPPRHVLGQLLALHGGALPRPGDRKYLAEVRAALDWVADIFDDPDSADTFTDEELLRDFCVPGIFAVARLQEAVTSSDDPWFVGDFGWVLTDFVPIVPPIPHKGAQGLWEVAPEALATLRERYRATPPRLPPALGAAEVQVGAASLPSLFQPGTPLRSPRQHLELNRLYGLAVGGDWITVIRRKDAVHWRSLRAGHVGSGTRGSFEAYLDELRGQQAGAA